VRRSAEHLAVELGMPERRIADLAIVAAEAAGNLVKHADEGQLLVRPVRAAGQAGVELIAIDSGPGMPDVTRSVGDGYSTAGTLGIGLGAILRQASWSDLHSVPGKGTVLAIQVWPSAAPEPARSWSATDSAMADWRRLRRRRRYARSRVPALSRRLRLSRCCTVPSDTLAEPHSPSLSWTRSGVASVTPDSATSPARSCRRTAAGAG
jgi:anti-sigma regulatory factor (Ser/Thr protein kinase)